MNPDLKEARRYHWQSENLPGFFDSPHTAVEGRNVGPIVNLADARAERNRRAELRLLLTPGAGARTLAALAFVLEVVHGAPSRFSDPARFSLAHGGKDGHPFPVPIRVYDETIKLLKGAEERARLGIDRRQLTFEAFVSDERANAEAYGGRTAGPR